MVKRQERPGRVWQKERTQAALLAAARGLLARGIVPTVDEAAVEAKVSRTTAFRYFPSQGALLIAAHPDIAPTTLLPTPPPVEPQARLDAVVEALLRITRDNEVQLRAMLRLSLEPDGGGSEALGLRQGRAIGWLEEALAPAKAKLGARRMRRLILAIRSAIGIEALVWLTDVAKLDRAESARLQRWSARALFQSAMAEAES